MDKVRMDDGSPIPPMSPGKLHVRPSRNGIGAFAAVPLTRGDLVWDWSGCVRYTMEQLPRPCNDDAFLQVGENLYIGPDGGPEEPPDFINHSCDPNCRVQVSPPEILIVALRDIRAGEEITYDYAEWMVNDPWEMNCNCGSPKCRGIVREPRGR
jgi:hypothetical protein